jgi:DNA-binding PucR family transcriptional regulator
MTLKDVLELPVMRLSSVVTRREIEEDREVTSVSVQEIPVGKFIRPGELVLSTGMNVGKDARRLMRFIRDVAESRAAALAVAIGPHTPHIPPSVVDAANQARLPLIQLPWEMRFSEISESILRRLIQEQALTLTRDDFVWALATQSASEDTLMAQAGQLGFGLRGPRVTVVGKLSGYGEDPALAQTQARLVEEMCRKMAAQSNLQWLGTAVGDSVLGYMQAPSSALKTVGILKTIQRMLRSKCIIAWGIGRICHEFADFQKSYEDARVACEIGPRVRGPESVTHVSDILADRVLLNLRRDADVLMLLERYIKPLEASKRTPLLLTLEVFFESDCNASAAARKLFISRQSLLYRLAKIETVLKIDLHSTEQRFAVGLALRLHRFHGETLQR